LKNSPDNPQGEAKIRDPMDLKMVVPPNGEPLDPHRGLASISPQD